MVWTQYFINGSDCTSELGPVPGIDPAPGPAPDNMPPGIDPRTNPGENDENGSVIRVQKQEYVGFWAGHWSRAATMLAM
jgi:hypothetical protein